MFCIQKPTLQSNDPPGAAQANPFPAPTANILVLDLLDAARTPIVYCIPHQGLTMFDGACHDTSCEGA